MQKRPLSVIVAFYFPLWLNAREARVFEVSFFWYRGPSLKVGVTSLSRYLPFEGYVYRPHSPDC
jgi:hypothetical protein